MIVGMSIHIFMSTPRLIMAFDLIIITLLTVPDSIKKKGEEKLKMVFKVFFYFKKKEHTNYGCTN